MLLSAMKKGHFPFKKGTCPPFLRPWWSTECVKSLRERHTLKYDRKEMPLKPGDVVLIKGEARNRGQLRIGIVEKLIQGRDNVGAPMCTLNTI